MKKTNILLLLLLMNLYSCFGGSEIESSNFDGQDVFVCVQSKEEVAINDNGTESAELFVQCDEVHGQKIEDFLSFKNGKCANGEAHINTTCDQLNVYEAEDKFARCDIGNKRTIYAAEPFIHVLLFPMSLTIGITCEILGDFEYLGDYEKYEQYKEEQEEQ